MPLRPMVARGVPARYEACGRAMEARVCQEGPGPARGRTIDDTPALFDDVRLEALYERHDVPLLGRRHLELLERRGRMAEEPLPVALADAHAPMAERHVPAAVVDRPSRAGAEE